MAIEELSYTHDAMIDYIIANPSVSGEQLAEKFGYGKAWISTIVNSDAFQSRLASRKSELVDPIITQSIENQLRGVLSESISVVSKKLSKPSLVKMEDAIKAVEVCSKALGYGARQDDSKVKVNVQNVVVVPTREATSDSWTQAYSPHNVKTIEANQ